MDIISFNEGSTANGRIENFIKNPDSTSGVVTVPSVIAAGETITIPAGRTAILPNIQVDGTLNVDGTVFIPTGTTTSKVIPRVASTDNAIVRFDGTTGAVQDSSVLIDDNGNLNIIGTGKRITGDFSNATLSNRLAFQSSATNDITYLSLIPNGTSTNSGISVFANSDINNANFGDFSNNSAYTRIRSSKSGAGVFTPIAFFTSDTERMRIAINGQIVSSLSGVNTVGYTFGGQEAGVGVSCPINGILGLNSVAGVLVYGTGALGYGTGSGGTVTQLTSKSTAVTLNKPNGQIIASNSSLAAGATTSFILNNTLLTGTDNIKVIVGGAGAAGAYQCDCTYCVNGAANITIKNLDAVSRTDAVAINFTVIKGANS